MERESDDGIRQGAFRQQLSGLQNSGKASTSTSSEGQSFWRGRCFEDYRIREDSARRRENDFTGAAFEGKFYAPVEFKALETLPTRAEIYSQLLGAIKGPASSVVSTIQAPGRDFVMVLKAYCKKLEEEGGAGQ